MSSVPLSTSSPSSALPIRAVSSASTPSRGDDAYPAATSLMSLSTAARGQFDPNVHQPDAERGRALLAPTGHCAYQLQASTVVQSGEKWVEAVVSLYITASHKVGQESPTLPKEVAERLLAAVRQAFVCEAIADKLRAEEIVSMALPSPPTPATPSPLSL